MCAVAVTPSEAAKARARASAESRCSGDGKHKCAARQAYSFKATGVRAPSRGISRPAPEHKDAA